MDDPQNKQHTDVVGQAQPPAYPTDPSVQQPVQAMPQVSPQPPVAQPPVSSPGQGFPPQQPISQPVVPTGSLSKEHLPPLAPDIVPAEHTEQQVELSQELKEAGVEQTPQTEHPQLTVEDRRAGLEPAKAAVPVSQVTGQSVVFPYTQEKAEELQKTTPISNSLRWLVESVLYHIKKTHAQLTQKEVK